MKRFILLALALLLLVGVAGATLIVVLNRPMRAQADALEFHIRQSEAVFSVTERLESEGIIRSAAFLRALMRVRGTDGDVKFGTLLLSPARTTLEIHDILLEGQEVLQKLTVREGLTARRIAEEIARSFPISVDELLSEIYDSDILEAYGLPYRNIEGFLFPDTYFFSEHSSAEQIVDHMVGQFFEKLAAIDVHPEHFAAQQFYETIVLASIVEREYVATSEAPKIASVFVNRLRANMKLQSCATIVYVLTEEQGREHPSRLFFSDLEYESPYNTYLHTGLPPAPISNAGIVALEAAFFPAETDYWFFVLKGRDAREHHFSRSGIEHIEAALLYLKDPS